jgi:MarR family transcriptional regulator, organic hydroperoxide resistance regulator
LARQARGQVGDASTDRAVRISRGLSVSRGPLHRGIANGGPSLGSSNEPGKSAQRFLVEHRVGEGSGLDGGVRRTVDEVIEDTQLFQMLKVTRRERAPIARLLAQYGLHPGQELLLAQLWREDGLTHGQLVARLRVQPPTVTKALQRLERAGFVQREPGTMHGRRVYLTSTGRELRVPVERAWAEADEQLRDRLTPRQRSSLAHLLSRLTAEP